MQIGLIGLGRMGGNMVERLMRNGHELVAFDRAPETVTKYQKLGATPANSRIAVEKGRTAAETRRSTAMWEERIKGGRTAMLRMPGVTPIQGGLPIVIDGECIGAVGVSGVQSHEDEQIAKAVDAVLDRALRER